MVPLLFSTSKEAPGRSEFRRVIGVNIASLRYTCRSTARAVVSDRFRAVEDSRWKRGHNALLVVFLFGRQVTSLARVSATRIAGACVVTGSRQRLNRLGGHLQNKVGAVCVIEAGCIVVASELPLTTRLGRT